MIARPKVWVTELAGRFWAEVGAPPPFPRDLRAVLCWSQGLHVAEVPNLTLATAAEHFARHGVPCPAPAENRPLAGCFGGHLGVGVILFDPTLTPAEVRFTLAHEVAHFLRDYQAPRRKVEARLGSRALEVLDGQRPPTVNERFAGVLRGVAIGCHTHFLDRDRRGRALTDEAREAEEAADRLAFELLAPFDAANPGASSDRAALVLRLTSDFGLPPAEAAKYAAVLVR
ncbi:MAG: ImmA/IrrE family metallo-endopeptidase [Planctomycetes bacterium]|nr:ImmA/IrrE family metallo-endopeptidase [Planctomycetota bacterium]